MEFNIKLEGIKICKNEMILDISGSLSSDEITNDTCSKPKLILYFDNKRENRRIPLVIQQVSYEENTCFFRGKYCYKLDVIFWETRKTCKNFNMSFNLSYGNFYEERIPMNFNEAIINFDNEDYLIDIKEDFIEFEKIEKVKKIDIKGKIKKIIKRLFYLFYTTLAILLFFVEGLFSIFGLADSPHKVVRRKPINHLIAHVNMRLGMIKRKQFKKTALKKSLIIFTYKLLSRKSVKSNKISFISARRNELSGNFEFIYNKIKDDKSLDINMVFNSKLPGDYSLKEIFEFCKACATSKVIVIDEFTPAIHYIDLKRETKLVQLWHACGAFKTFGFTRLGKPKGSPQVTRNHRNYDYVTVSSTYCKRCHSEGFGISDEKVVPIGIPRTDVFFDENYKDSVRKAFFEKYPQFKNKKIIMFAPTFRGHVKETAHYPVSEFDLKEVYDALGEDYAVIIKHHPFVKKTHPIPEEYSHLIIDLSSESELNDLLFVSDVVITDYSSLVFEASLLKVPMLFYAFDLNKYIRERDFYFDFKLNVPGKIVSNLDELIDAIRNEDYETEKIAAFSKKFFDYVDGKSTERVSNLITSLIE